LPRELRLADLLPSGKAIAVAFSVLALAVLLYFGARETSVFAVRTIEIHGASPTVAAHVRAALRPLDGKSLLAVHAADVIGPVERLPDVAGLTYDRDFPHTIRVRVVPAHTIAVVRRGPSAWLVSSDGRVVRPAGRTSAPGLPRIWVPGTVDVTTGRRLADGDAAAALDAVAVARRNGFARHIAAVRASDHELTFVLDNHVELRFGDASDLALKVTVARRVLPLASGYGYVDVSAPDRPVAGGQASTLR
jgi:cell division protein FtsQ